MLSISKLVGVTASGLDFATTVFLPATGGSNALRVLRFDRTGEQRHRIGGFF